MKWMILLGITLLTTACCTTTTEIVQYRQVAVAPVVQPVILDVDYPQPLDVTTTTIDFY